jgi:hypothetical protein
MWKSIPGPFVTTARRMGWAWVAQMASCLSQNIAFVPNVDDQWTIRCRTVMPKLGRTSHWSIFAMQRPNLLTVGGTAIFATISKYSQARRSRYSIGRAFGAFYEKFSRRGLAGAVTQEAAPFPLSVNVWTQGDGMPAASVARAKTLNSGLKRRTSIRFVTPWAARTWDDRPVTLSFQRKLVSVHRRG